MQKLKFGNLYWERTPIRLSAKQTKAEGLSGFPAKFHQRNYSSVQRFTDWYLGQIREIEEYILGYANHYKIEEDKYKNFYELYSNTEAYEAHAFDGVRRVYEICAERFMDFVFKSIHKITQSDYEDLLVSTDIIETFNCEDYEATVITLPMDLEFNKDEAFLGGIMWKVYRRFIIDYGYGQYYTCVLPENTNQEQILSALLGHLDGVCHVHGTSMQLG